MYSLQFNASPLTSGRPESYSARGLRTACVFPSAWNQGAWKLQPRVIPGMRLISSAASVPAIIRPKPNWSSVSVAAS